MPDSTFVWVGVTVVSSLVSGLIGVLVSTLAYRRLERRRVRVDTVRKLLANRFNMKSVAVLQALNEAIVVFHDCPDVVRQLKAFHHVVVTRPGEEAANDAFVSLLKVLCRRSAITLEGVNDGYLLRPFGTDTATSLR